MDKHYEDLIVKTSKIIAEKHIRYRFNTEKPEMEKTAYEYAVETYVKNNWSQWRYLAIDCMRETSKKMTGKPNKLEECLSKIYQKEGNYE